MKKILAFAGSESDCTCRRHHPRASWKCYRKFFIPVFYKTVQVGENGLCIIDDLLQKKLFQLVRDFEKLKLQVP